MIVGRNNGMFGHGTFVTIPGVKNQSELFTLFRAMGVKIK